MTRPLVSTNDLSRLKRGFRTFPEVASRKIYSAQVLNANEAKSQMQALIPTTGEGVTKGNSTATAYRNSNDGAIGFAMTTERRNRAERNGKADADERIKAILYANGTNFFYGVWNLNKRRWRGRMRRAMNSSAKEVAGRLR